MGTLLGFSLFDLGAALLLLVVTLYGAWKGMARLVVGVVGLAVAWVVATRYSEPLALRWGARSGEAEALRGAPEFIRVIAFVCLFLAVAVAASILGWLISRMLGAVMLGGLDRLLGAGLGLVFAMLLVCALTVPVVAALPPDGGALLSESILAPYAIAGGEWLAPLAPESTRRRFELISRAYLAGTRPAPPRPASAPRGAPAPRRR